MRTANWSVGRSESPFTAIAYDSGLNTCTISSMLPSFKTRDCQSVGCRNSNPYCSLLYVFQFAVSFAAGFCGTLLLLDVGKVVFCVSGNAGFLTKAKYPTAPTRMTTITTTKVIFAKPFLFIFICLLVNNF